jgi:hypothetical protein
VLEKKFFFLTIDADLSNHDLTFFLNASKSSADNLNGFEKKLLSLALV